MSGDTSYDVVVAGAGPGGSMAAKLCAGAGLRTLLLEKKALPREKVCTGMLMAPWCRSLLTSEFGPVPERVLCSPRRLSGHRMHVPGEDPVFVECETPVAWRKDLDIWLTQGAARAGAEIRERTRLLHVEQGRTHCAVRVERGGRSATLRAGHVVGADGAASSVRKALFPDLAVAYSAPIRWFYEGALDMDRKVIHWFFPRSRPRPRFDLVHKGEGFLLEGSGVRSLGDEIPAILAEYGFRGDWRPAWRDGCLVARLHGPLADGAFRPAAGRVLLVGDAAGLILPLTFEGIGTALESGRLAALAIQRAASGGGVASTRYLEGLAPLLGMMERLRDLDARLEQTAAIGAGELAVALAAAYGEAMEDPRREQALSSC